jgi:hypothetical protein
MADRDKINRLSGIFDILQGYFGHIILFKIIKSIQIEYHDSQLRQKIFLSTEKREGIRRIIRINLEFMGHPASMENFEYSAAFLPF